VSVIHHADDEVSLIRLIGIQALSTPQTAPSFPLWVMSSHTAAASRKLTLDRTTNRFGLSYTTFAYKGVSLSKPSGSGADFKITVSFAVTNTGSLWGSEVAQVYTSLPPTSSLTHVPRALKGFHKVHNLAPGWTGQAEVVLDKYAVSYWDDRVDRWVAEAGVYTVYVGASSDDVRCQGTFVIGKEFSWTGL
jgi:beta-glucosidase